MAAVLLARPLALLPGGQGAGAAAGTPAPLASQDRCHSKRVPQTTRCTGCPPMHNGKLCASTTRYNDQTKAACGCGKSDPVPSDWWTLTKLTAALNCKNLDSDHPLLSWCPAGCGGCYRLCTTGGTTQGLPTKPDVCRVFKITNRCGDGFDLVDGHDWCSQHMSWQECMADPERCKKDGSTNWFGYSAHFDLQDFHNQVLDGLGWDNVEVTFEAVPCNGTWTGPSWDCMCPSAKPEVSAGDVPSSVTSAPGGAAVAAAAGGTTSSNTSRGSHSGVPGLGKSAALAVATSSTNRGTMQPVTLQTNAPTAKPQRCARAFDQCGGLAWGGPTCCEPGCRCSSTVMQHWRQCVPPHGQATCAGNHTGTTVDVTAAVPPVAAPAPHWTGILVRKDDVATPGDMGRAEHKPQVPLAGEVAGWALLWATMSVALSVVAGLTAFAAASLRARLQQRPQLLGSGPLAAVRSHGGLPFIAEQLAEAGSPLPMLPSAA